MRPTHVVTCFLRRGGRVLVLRRSQDVRTHKGLWAGVSGYVEQGEEPIGAAYRELEEEVGAGPDRIELVREARPIVFDDPPSGRVWAVHPFLFEDRGVDVETDWEHVETRWVEPPELSALETVPYLRETLMAAMGEDVQVPRDEGEKRGP
jgi:8-oxo-dGTP pyrophosphatase MutT (NUDIX family)